MPNSQQQTDEQLEPQCIVPIVVTTPVVNGIIGGISSVITAYFFRPIFENIMSILDRKENYWRNKK